MKKNDELDKLIDQHMVMETGNLCKFKMPKGKNFKVNIFFHSAYKGRDPEYKNIRSKYKGTYITISHHGKRLPIGSRRWFKTKKDAEIAAQIWNAALQNSNTRWDITAEVTTRNEQKAWEKANA